MADLWPEERTPPAGTAQVQASLSESSAALPDVSAPNKKRRIAEHARETKAKCPTDNADESTLVFDERRVPVEVIAVTNPEAAGLRSDEFEVIGKKVSHGLAQRPGSYVILKYVRPVIKRHDTQILSCPPAPVGVLNVSRADASVIAGMIVDKFAFHLPLYRQHQRLRDAGIDVSRPWLTQIGQSAAAMLEPIHDAQLDAIRASRVISMDETPIKAGPNGHGEMNAAYFWPVCGEMDEICFLYYQSRSARHVQEALGLSPPKDAVLQTDGYGAYAQYAKKTAITHAQCWAHSRRKMFEAQDMEPTPAKQMLDWIGALYAVE